MLRCGTGDHLLAQTNGSYGRARRGVALDRGFGPGVHEWDYWDTGIRTVIDWQ